MKLPQISVMRNIPHLPSRKIVQNRDFKAFIQQSVHKMTANKTSATSH
jgi:hypothetical protein